MKKYVEAHSASPVQWMSGHPPLERHLELPRKIDEGLESNCLFFGLWRRFQPPCDYDLDNYGMKCTIIRLFKGLSHVEFGSFLRFAFLFNGRSAIAHCVQKTGQQKKSK